MMPLIKTFEHLQIQLEAIKSATNSFDAANCIGSGGFGKVYKGELAHSKGKTMVALKRLDRIYGQGEAEFWKEVIMLSLYKHENIVSLLGFCDDSKEKILVYEYLSKGSLDLYLEKDDLTWVRRLRICIGAARGLAYLHSSVGTQQRDEINPNSLKAFASIAYQCLNRDRETRPLMTEIMRELEKALEYQGVKTHDHHQENYNIAYKASTNFHFMSARRERFGLEELLGAEAELSRRSSLGISYKAVLSKGPVVVKRFKLEVIKEGMNVDFHAHMMLLGSISHPNLLPYVAYYQEGMKKLLITDFAVNGSMASHLHVKPKDSEPGLDWPTRLKIIQGVARGLNYLHQQFPGLSLPHGHLSSLNVLLDSDFNPLLADYALAPIIEKKAAKAYMRAYKSPEFTKHKQRVMKKTDVWCLGILILETLTGKSPLNYLEQGKSTTEQEFVTWVNSLGREEWTNKVFDKGMKWAKNNEIEMIDLMVIGLHCCESDVTRRWSMRKVCEKIQGLRETENEEEYLPDSSEEYDFNPLLADYALAPIIEKKAAKAYMRAYKSPEFTKHKQRVMKKTDVWCLGILILETLTGKSPLNYLEQGKSTTEQEFVTWVNSLGREEWTNKVFDKGMKWAKNNEIEMIDLMVIGLHCCESDVTRRWSMRKVCEKIQGLRETENEEEYLPDSSEE
ncbi:leucine-rich repeat protein kinase family protein [Artemisia annua]|uniref:Leucine-rich repeat protein kinase family protein n=1 Tax=Artemisia annua TaxID=35608 RepID=A0A2U1NAV2_ARTAN|nr:leucine-rich repeat protein kinase family protein [Artemisia annua]